MDDIKATGEPWIPPGDWQQLAKPSPWNGVEVSHYRAPPGEILHLPVECAYVSLLLKAHECEVREDGEARWRLQRLGKGTVSFMPPPYCISLRWGRPTEAINIALLPKWFNPGLGDHALRYLPHRPRFDVTDRVAATLIQEIYHDNLQGAPNGLAYAETLSLAALFRFGAIDLKNSHARLQSTMGFHIDRAVQYIHDNLGEGLSISEVMTAVDFPGNHYSFIRAFKRHSGLSPHQYIVQARLEQAKRLLLGKTRSVTDVALTCGFPSLSHFSMAFKKRWGVSPSVARGKAQ